MRVSAFNLLSVLNVAVVGTAFAQSPPRTHTLFKNVRVVDVRKGELTKPVDVLIGGNTIEKIAESPIPIPAEQSTLIIEGQSKSLMPGLIDAHTHIMFSTVPSQVVLTSDVGYLNVAAVKEAEDMLMRGFTSIRDLGGPCFGLKRGIDQGLVAGPRIWPSGAFISQSGGHGDFRLPTDIPAQPGDFTHSERTGAAAIADSPDKVRQRVREQLMLGASQIKLMAGGGVSSNFDPLDVTQYTVEEIRASVEAAENWGTYVTVHAYTARAVRQSIEAGVKCIDHGQLLDDETARLMAEKGVWWSLQPFVDDRPSPFPEGSPNRIKQLTMFAGTDLAYKLAKKYRIKTAWGTDILFSPDAAKAQGTNLSKMVRWYTPAEAIRMATVDNAALLALSGLRSPYPGKLGIVEEGALADLILVDGNPLDDLPLVDNPDKNFVVIMKDGKVFKNMLSSSGR